jgi:hypothetical protein
MMIKKTRLCYPLYLPRRNNSCMQNGDQPTKSYKMYSKQLTKPVGVCQIFCTLHFETRIPRGRLSIGTICKGNPVMLRKSLSLAGGNPKMNINGYNTWNMKY